MTNLPVQISGTNLGTCQLSTMKLFAKRQQLKGVNYFRKKFHRIFWTES